MVESLHMPLLFFAGKCLVALPFMYHLFNGVRHLTWDTGVNLTNNGIGKSALAVAVLTIGSTLFLASL